MKNNYEEAACGSPMPLTTQLLESLTLTANRNQEVIYEIETKLNNLKRRDPAPVDPSEKLKAEVADCVFQELDGAANRLRWQSNRFEELLSWLREI